MKLASCKCRLKCNENFSDNSRSMINHEYCALGDSMRQKDFLYCKILSFGKLKLDNDKLNIAPLQMALKI